MSQIGVKFLYFFSPSIVKSYTIPRTFKPLTDFFKKNFLLRFKIFLTRNYQTKMYKKIPFFIAPILECLNSSRVKDRDRQVEEGAEEALRLP